MNADEVRARLVGALNTTKVNAKDLSTALGREPDFLGDFLRGRTDQLSSTDAAFLEVALGLEAGALRFRINPWCAP